MIFIIKLTTSLQSTYSLDKAENIVINIRLYPWVLAPASQQ